MYLMNEKRRTFVRPGYLVRVASLLVVASVALSAQVAEQRGVVPLKNWEAPPYWQPTQAESHGAATAVPNSQLADVVSTDALAFVAMTPCRVADTRASQNFPPLFGPPGLAAGGAPGGLNDPRVFPIQSSPAPCAVPAIAQAYSFNVTAVPVPGGQPGYVTIFPTPSVFVSAPVLATLTTQTLIVTNAAIVAAGIRGEVSVVANVPTDLVIDINGFFAVSSG